MTQDEAVGCVDQLKDLVAPDGGDLALVSFDPAGREITLDMNLDNVECLECIMPRDYLERLALNIFAKTMPQLEKVVILDPRERA
jgi:hypothetical protein